MALFLALAAAGFAQTTKPPVPLAALKTMEAAIDVRIKTPAQDSWSVLGDTRGTYLAGYGAVFTFEMALANLAPVTPFHLTVSPEEKKSGHARKVKNLNTLKAAMREMIANAAGPLASMPANEQITVEAFLFYFNWEDRTGLPERVKICANRQKVAEAVARHATPAEMAAIFEERSE